MSVPKMVTAEASTGPVARGDRQAEEMWRALGMGNGRRWLRRVVWLLVLCALAVGGYLLYGHFDQPPAPPVFRTIAVDRGDIVTVVSATGTVEPVRTVEVGAEISGRVVAIEVDSNSVVTAGQVLVRLDTEPLEAQLEQAEAQLEAAKASVREAAATVELSDASHCSNGRSCCVSSKVTGPGVFGLESVWIEQWHVLDEKDPRDGRSAACCEKTTRQFLCCK